MVATQERHLVDEVLIELGARPDDLQSGVHLGKVVEYGDPAVTDHEVYQRMVALFRRIGERLTDRREMSSHDREALIMSRLETTSTVFSLRLMVDTIKAELDQRK